MLMSAGGGLLPLTSRSLPPTASRWGISGEACVKFANENVMMIPIIDNDLSFSLASAAGRRRRVRDGGSCYRRRPAHSEQLSSAGRAACLTSISNAV
jgi:hypothetical protein